MNSDCERLTMNDLTPFLTKLFEIIAIDIEHLNQYLKPHEKEYLNRNLVSMEALNDDLYSSELSDNLEVLVNFLVQHADDIGQLWQDNDKKELLVDLYISGTISGEYDCFHFDLSKFSHSYISSDQQLTLYRIGRVGETVSNVGNSWSYDATGLKAYAQFVSGLASRPVFSMQVHDSEVLCKGQSKESELILKKGFTADSIKLISTEERQEIGV
ncbi:hypothetical protein GCM10007906_15380 [Vibrio hyugaensis]|uniref:Uncharacterized protein n=2 Tax=Vibrio hyugaensis TaxID=1534743 RepID=A0ABQ5XZ57_9VIBR|nr:hypothetical protein GCM10007906_15380 [Vibrio hyugaensis]